MWLSLYPNICFAIPTWILLGLYFGSGLWWVIPLNMFLFHPLMDAALEHPKLRHYVERRLFASRFHRPFVATLPLIYPVVQIVVFGLALQRARSLGMESGEFWGLALVTGAMCGSLGITLAHELIHRAQPAVRALGLGLLWNCSYPHFYIDHIYSHHRMVGTPEDAATARMGESLFRFFGRGIRKAILNSWNLKRKLFFAFWLVQVAVYVALGIWGGLTAVVFMAVQSVAAILLLETVNYVEHYGLERKRLSSGRFEAVSSQHSWDSRHFLTNVGLFNLGMHSDHHARPRAMFLDLSLKRSTHFLPYGFPVMMVLAWFPPAWFAVMDPQVRLARDSAPFGVG